jgi:hypothetical protein
LRQAVVNFVVLGMGAGTPTKTTEERNPKDIEPRKGHDFHYMEDRLLKKQCKERISAETQIIL